MVLEVLDGFDYQNAGEQTVAGRVRLAPGDDLLDEVGGTNRRLALEQEVGPHGFRVGNGLRIAEDVQENRTEELDAVRLDSVGRKPKLKSIEEEGERGE